VPPQEAQEPATVEKQPTTKSEQKSFKPKLTLKQQSSAKEIISSASEAASFGKLTTVKESSNIQVLLPILDKSGDKTN
jgi:beta-glucanase (GH16 family)